MLFLSDFADLGLVLPLAALVALALAMLGRRRDALAWCLAVGGTLGATAVLKVLVFVAIGPQGWAGLGNPSGHAASATIAYGGLAALVAGRLVPRLPVGLLTGLASGLLVGFTRVELRVHSLADVLVGVAVGLAGLLALDRLAGPAPAAPRRAGLPVLAAVALAAMLAFHGQRLLAEPELRAIAAHLQPAGDRAFD
ncbi:phosphatase PAP2 family protein [Dankookia rubra]|uniref:Phosphatase PAP2 family protein n=1 Tax=Dankookia rubra TaxID=1442381 RepID=A0A4R5Q6N7_9PROT|nr:phosphatase PAP2 family protein [Dankookia rubra]TDH57911.1 phosphatase PAP2 family protein [Dankookia rubra]